MSHEDIDHHVRIYMRVFAALVVLTVITVAVSYLHLPPMPALALGLTIALIKGSLVACYFMHLISEKKMLLWIMSLSLVFFFFELLIPMVSEGNNLHMGA